MGIYLNKDGISYLWSKIKNKFYTKPSTGIPKSDLASSVQASLDKADTALQSHQDISGKQDKSTAVTHTANTAVGSTTKPVYVAANGVATVITHSISSDVPANAKFTDTVYTHPTTSGNKHIPSGGSSGQILRWSADGTAVWGADNNTTYSDATQSAHGLMSAADKKKLDGMDLSKYLPLAGGTMSGNIDLATNKVDLLVGSQPAAQSTTTSAVAGGTVSPKLSFGVGLPARKSIVGTWLDENNVFHDIISVRHRNGHGDGTNYGMYLRSLLTSGGCLIWNKQTAADTWQGERVLLDSVNYSTYAAKSDHTHDAITNSSRWASGANNAAQWVRLGTVVSSGNFATAVISVWSGDGANGNASQNSWFEIHIKDGWQPTESATKACGVTVYRTRCNTVKVKVIPTAHNTYTVWVYLPWTYWNSNYSVHGKYSSWTPQVLKQTAEPDGTAADTAYYDQAFLTSTVAAANALTETAWTAVPTTGATSMNINSLKYKKVGQMVYVLGDISFTASQSTGKLGTLPSGCRPSSNVYTAGWDGNKVAAFGIVVDTSGVISLQSPSSTAGWFDKNLTFHISCNFVI